MYLSLHYILSLTSLSVSISHHDYSETHPN
jgi:hypothetical protein